jgi:hypothetical protein
LDSFNVSVDLFVCSTSAIPPSYPYCTTDPLVFYAQRMLLEYEPLTDAAKAKALRKGETYFYVFFIGTREDCRGRGAFF